MLEHSTTPKAVTIAVEPQTSALTCRGGETCGTHVPTIFAVFTRQLGEACGCSLTHHTIQLINVSIIMTYTYFNRHVDFLHLPRTSESVLPVNCLTTNGSAELTIGRSLVRHRRLTSRVVCNGLANELRRQDHVRETRGRRLIETTRQVEIWNDI